MPNASEPDTGKVRLVDDIAAGAVSGLRAEPSTTSGDGDSAEFRKCSNMPWKKGKGLKKKKLNCFMDLARDLEKELGR